MLTERIRTAMEEQMAACENPFYLYDQKTILEQTGRLKQDFPGFEFLYSIKTNPFLPVVKTVLGQGFGLDAASLREVQIGVEQGLPREKILYSAPGKTRRDLEGAVDHAILVADSLHELELLDGIAQQRGQRLQVGVRVNPSFTMEGDPGTPAKFGIDEEQLLALDLARFPHLEMVGIHVHARSQELDASMLARYYGDIFALARRCVERLGISLEFVNLGGGLGIAFDLARDKDLDTAALGTAAQKLLADLKGQFPGVRVLIESGRYAVCDSGYYVTRVVDVKESRGVKFVMLQSTLNGFARPALAQMVAVYHPDPVEKMWEPLFTAFQAFQFLLLTDETETEKVNLVGNLCTGTDIIGTGVQLPRAKVGDLLAITKAGAYAYVITPVQFSSQPVPGQYLLTADGRMVDC